MLIIKAASTIVLLIGLILLYRYLPSRRIFFIFCSILVAAGIITYASFHHTEEPQATQQHQYDIQQQQEIFAPWYEDYKKDIEHLDNDWQQYHNILESFKEDNISIQTTYVRLTHLETDSAQLQKHLGQLAPPLELETENYDLAAAVIQKAKAYAEQQHTAILRTRDAADPAHIPSDDQAEQSRILQEVMIRESPAALFTADEISSLRDNLTLPQEK